MRKKKNDINYYEYVNVAKLNLATKLEIHQKG